MDSLGLSPIVRPCSFRARSNVRDHFPDVLRAVKLSDCAEEVRLARVSRGQLVPPIHKASYVQVRSRPTCSK